MKLLKRILIFTLPILVSSTACQKSDDGSRLDKQYAKEIKLSKSQKQVLSGLNDFGLDLFGRLCKENGYENTALSPFSIESALLLAMAGENESSDNYREMAEAIRQKSTKRDNLLASYNTLINEIGAIDNSVNVTVANSVWSNTDLVPGGFSSSFSQRISDNLQADVNAISFSKDDAKTMVNEWIFNKTHGKIKEMLSNAPDGYSILSNAIFMDGNWKYRFLRTGQQKDFYNHDSSITEVETMTLNYDLWARETDAYKACMFPLGKNFAVTVILPKQSIDKLVSSFDGDAWESLCANWQGYHVWANIPPFKEEFSTDGAQLKPVLNDMGMIKAFSDRSFTEMFNNHVTGSISNILHKASIDFNDKGTTAAASTVIMLDGAMGPTPGSPLNVMRFDVYSPFLYIYHETSTNTILFAGIKSRME